jgi:hypothetical protein
MKKSTSGLRKLAVFVWFIILSYVVFLLFLFLVWRLLGAIRVPSEYILAVGALSSIGSTVAILGGGYVAFRQLSEIANSRHLGVADKLFDELNSRENTAARRWVFQNLPADPQEGIRSLTPEGQEAVKQVLNSLDRVAFLTQAGWIPEDLIMPWMHPMIAKSWDKLEPYVAYEKQRRNEPYYYAHASELAVRCRAWREKHLEDAQVKWVKDAL